MTNAYSTSRTQLLPPHINYCLKTRNPNIGQTIALSGTLLTDSAIDKTNSQRVEKYMNNDDISEIYCVALAVMGMHITSCKEIDINNIEKIVGHTIRKTFGLDKERYNLEYKKKVQKAVEDMDHLIHSLTSPFLRIEATVFLLSAEIPHIPYLQIFSEAPIFTPTRPRKTI